MVAETVNYSKDVNASYVDKVKKVGTVILFCQQFTIFKRNYIRQIKP